MEIYDDLCGHCQRGLNLDGPVAAAWRGTAELLAVRERLKPLQAGPEPRTWLGYARALAASPVHQDTDLRALLAEVDDDDAAAADRDELLAVWAATLNAWEEMLADWRAAAPAAEQAARVSAARERTLARKHVREESRRLAAIITGNAFPEREVDPVHLAADAWKQARITGGTSEDSRTGTMKLLADRYGDACVRDVSLLPQPLRTPYRDQGSPAAWANEELQTLWREWAIGWIDGFEEAYRAAGPSSDGQADLRRLVLLRGWPLTREADQDIAYLAQFPCLGTVPDGHRRARGYWSTGENGPTSAVVLAVPEFAATHAAELVDSIDQQTHAALPWNRRRDPHITLGPQLTGDAEPPAEQVDELLRLVYPYLPTDAARDQPHARPSTLVKKARAKQRAGRPTLDTILPGAGDRPDIRQLSYAWHDGLWPWIPDDTPTAGRAARVLTNLLNNTHAATCRLDVETGPRPDTALHSLFGHLEAFDPQAATVAFAPAGGHRCLSVPLHRIVAITGERADDDDRALTWSGYDELRRR